MQLRHMRSAVITGFLMLGVTTAGAQHAGHSAGAPHDGHRAAEACTTEFEQVIATGRGFGMAFAADQNGYPGPLHVLELRERLGLTADQVAKMETLMRDMFDQSRPKSARLLDAKAKLRRLFADGKADDGAVRTAVAEVERARSDVRLVHLLAHLRTRDLLFEQQRRAYHEARWGAPGGASMPHSN